MESSPQAFQLTPDSPVYVSNAANGLGLFAGKAFQKGEHILTEEVFVSQIRNFVSARNLPLPYALCSYCVRFLGPIEKQLELVCRSVGKTLPSRVAQFSPPLPAAVKCNFCTAEYCSEECKQKSWDQSHSLLCSRSAEVEREDMKKFNELSQKREFYPARPQMIAKLLANILIETRKRGGSVEEVCDQMLGQFLTVPFTEAIEFRERSVETRTNVITPTRFSLRTCKPPEGDSEAIISAKYLEEPRRLLSSALHEEIATISGANLLFEPSVFNSIAGIFLLNSREVRIFSPLHSYFEKIQSSQHSFPFLPILFKIESMYGGIPRVDLSALCKIYSALNHSCDCNTVTGLNEREECYSTSDQYARSSIYAKKDIREGEELTTNYVANEALNLTERHEILESHYFFSCTSHGDAQESDDETNRGRQR